jgi:2-amino-4-hydroxy-6-hydroxymethyldihydropteridine diphosphokinase
MSKVSLLIGGNQGDRQALMEQATEQIRQRIGSVVALSRVYETEPWGEFEETPTPSAYGGHPSLQGGDVEGSLVAAPAVPSLQGGVPVGRGGGKVPMFLNRGLLVETTLSPWQVLRTALSIEAGLGRQRDLKDPKDFKDLKDPKDLKDLKDLKDPRLYHSRPMDIDLIFYDDLVVDTSELTLPHPRMHLRRFVLEPLAEIMPDYRHPLMGKSMKELLSEL